MSSIQAYTKDRISALEKIAQNMASVKRSLIAIQERVTQATYYPSSSNYELFEAEKLIEQTLKLVKTN